MDKPLFPTEGGKCTNPKCQRKHKKLLYKLEANNKRAEELIKRFFIQPNAFELFKPTYHTNSKRYVERAINHRELFEMLEELADVVECPDENSAIYKTIRKSNWKGKPSYIYFHVMLSFSEVEVNNNVVLVARSVTAYNVSVSSHLYNEHFEERHCWCQPQIYED